MIATAPHPSVAATNAPVSPESQIRPIGVLAFVRRAEAPAFPAGESLTLEYKEKFSAQLVKSVASMANTYGGLIADGADFDFRLRRATIDTNTRQRQRIVDKVRVAVTGRRDGSLSRSRIGVLGLTFKSGTNDLRDSPALAVAALLRRRARNSSATTPSCPRAMRILASSRWSRIPIWRRRTPTRWCC